MNFSPDSETQLTYVRQINPVSPSHMDHPRAPFIAVLRDGSCEKTMRACNMRIGMTGTQRRVV